MVTPTMSVGVVTGCAVAVAALVLLRKKKAAKPEKPKKLQVYGTGPIEGVSDMSPPCLKLLAFLNMAKVEYDYVPYGEHMLAMAPKKKVPFVWGDMFDEPLGDSQFIIEALQARGVGAELDAWLTVEQKAIATAFRVMLEESIYFAIATLRWADKHDFDTITRDIVFAAVPALLRPYIAGSIRKDVVRTLYGQGLGRHSTDEIVHLMQTQIGAIDTFLGENAFLFGAKPCSLDCVLFAFVTNFAAAPWDHPLSRLVRSFDRLMAHCARIKSLTGLTGL